jgi:hypothetical protein
VWKVWFKERKQKPNTDVVMLHRAENNKCRKSPNLLDTAGLHPHYDIQLTVSNGGSNKEKVNTLASV